MRQKLKQLIEHAIQKIVPENKANFVVEHPDEISHGDYSTNVALVLGKALKKNPLTLAIQIADEIEKEINADLEIKKYIEKVEVAGIGFINFYLSQEFFALGIKEIHEKGDNFGKSNLFLNKKVSVEYTDPNPFKQLHIGHLMTNIIGESIAGLFEWNGAEVKRFCYQGDVGRHVALTLWGIRFMDKPMPEEDAGLNEKTKYLGEAYSLASKKIIDEPEHEAEIQKINKKIYDRSDPEVNEIYDKGREWSLEHFEEIYQKLGTKFDRYFFESQATPIGLQIVKENTPEIFKESEGAIIFKGEEYNLHTVVFITKEDLPTYAGKELGLAKLKEENYLANMHLVMTGNEQSDYFNVFLKVLSLIFPEISNKFSHLSHGMLRFTSGKMSSRTGDVVTGESLIDEMIKSADEKIKDRKLPDFEKKKIAEQVAIGAIKYSILKQSIGKDIIFDKEKSLSFEGDSGPYLQYAHTRAVSILRNAEEAGIKSESKFVNTELTKMLYRFPEIIEEGLELRAPHHVLTYLIELSSLFNRFYSESTIVDSKSEESSSRVALTEAFQIVIKNGLNVLGIPIPKKM